MTAYCEEYWKISNILWRAQGAPVKDHEAIAGYRMFRQAHLRACPICNLHFRAMTDQARNAVMPEFEDNQA